MAKQFPRSHVSHYPNCFSATWKTLLFPVLLLIMVNSVTGEKGRIEIYECSDIKTKTKLSVECFNMEQKFKESDDYQNDEQMMPIPDVKEFAQNFALRNNLTKLSDSDSKEVREDKPIEMYQHLSSSMNTTEFWEPPPQILMKIPNGSARKFKMVQQNFTCPSDKIIKEFYWHPLLGVGDGQSLQNCLKRAKITPSNMSIIEDGKLVWNKEEAESHVYRPDSYCVSSGDKNGWVTFKVCIANCSISPCVRKCCPPSKVIDSTTKKCISATPDWRPIFYRSAGQQDLNTENVGPNASFIVGFPNCPDKYIIERNLTHRKKYVTQSSPKNNFQLLLNGTLVQIDGARHTYIKAGEFCIDGINYKDSKGVDDTMESEVTYSRSEWDQVVIACIPTELRGEIKWRMPLYATLNHISALFLLVTDIVYILLWKHQNIHGWLQFAYATSLFCTFNCFVVVQRWSRELMHTSQSLCKVMGWITHLTYLSAFFWLTSMNFDLWWRFSRPLKSTRLRSQETKWRRFLGFAIFSIVVPLLISGVGITLDYFYEEELLEPPFTIPGFGKEQCYFESKRSQIPYLYGPAGILLLIDMIFFTSTVLHLRKIHAHTELARTQSTMEDKKGLKVILKLFIVMGVLWVFELIKWIAHILLPEEETTLIWIFIPVDILNSLQGVAIFFIFVCKPNVGSQLLALFRKDDPAKTWNKQTQFPSVTVQQPSKQNDFSDIK